MAQSARDEGRPLEAKEVVERADFSLEKIGMDKNPSQYVMVFLLKSNIEGICQNHIACETAAQKVISHSAAGPKERAEALFLLGLALRGLARFDDARIALNQARTLYEDLGMSVGIANINLNIGAIYLEHGDFENAVAVFSALIDLGEEAGPAALADSEMNLGVIHLIQGDIRRGVMHLERIARKYTEQKNEYQLCMVLHNLGMARLDMEDPVEALEQFIRAEEMSLDVGRYGTAANCAISAAQAAILLEDAQYAEEACNRARSEYARSGDALGLCECVKIDGSIAHLRGESTKAELMLREGISEFKKHSNPLGVAECEYELGLTYIAAGNPVQAMATLVDAREKFKTLGADIDVVRCNRQVSQLGS
ncbi:MAG: tetratricopeptide (TPR) repeat protein [Candidatus Latescibacterota bacterium]|jgi:tetratricopeptide (TPR) repeat protein